MNRVARGLVTIMMGAGVLGPAMNASAQTGQEAVFVMTNAADKNEVIALSGVRERRLLRGSALCNRGKGQRRNG